ncbi:glycosyltransferase [uncultured Pelagimonas sp.]|uniref:glycosyltransferase family 2 protein n=1 Tax=uncultured Pelagimonas sp. TaxID=1618102 RepID=UPI00262F90C6|nr:glycosyltransferase [uncultured Pelagimonas sp.]
MTTPHLSIVIITLNEEKRLPLLLSDLAAQTWTDFEVIHVDSKSTDRTVDVSHGLAHSFEHYRVIEMQNRGVSLGRNTGAAVAQGKRLLFLDADTRLGSDFLRTALGELEDEQAAVGIVTMSTDGLAIPYKLGFNLFNAGIRLTSVFFPTAIGACLFSTPQMHAAIEGFDESLSLCEDCNYALKAHRRDRRAVSVLRQQFHFDPRRLEQDGFATTGLTYLRANIRRFFSGELHNQEIPYEFGHYK